MNLWQRVRFALGAKESQARIVATMNQLGNAVSTPENYDAYATQGMQKNIAVFASIQKIARAGAGIRLVHYTGTRRNPTELMESPLLALLARPNPMQAYQAFIESVLAFYMLDGNSYIESNNGVLNGGGTIPLELWPVRPDKMKVIAGTKGYPQAYEFSSGGVSRRWPVNIKDLQSQILHWKTFHPSNDWYGLSPLSAALNALDQNNAGQRWNLALLQNSATPSGVLQVNVTAGNVRGALDDKQYARIKNEFEAGHVGQKNAGRPLILEGGLNWQSIALSPKEMDFLKSKEVTAIDICIAFGVPPELMGLGTKTFNNYREARSSFYEETVLPVLDSLLGELNRWLVPTFGENSWLDYDKDDIEALSWKREAKFTMLAAADFLTQNEKREATGYDKAEGWDVFKIGTQLVAKPEDLVASTFGTPTEEDTTDEEADVDENGDEPNPDKPTKKPPKDKEPEEDEEADDAKGWKSINLLNPNEKRKSWARQNARRAKLRAVFHAEMKAEYEHLTDAMIAATTGLKEPRLVEFALLKTATKHMPHFKETVKRNIRRTVDSFGTMILDESKSLGMNLEQKANRRFEDYARDYTSTRSGEAIKTITQTTQKRIRQIVGEWAQTAIQDGDTLPDLAKFINSEFGELNNAQAMRIARTEVAMASNNANREAVKSLQIPNMFKEWISAEDDRVRHGGDSGNDADHRAMNGEEVPLDSKFTVPPDRSMEGPGDDAGGADQVINCRCVLAFRSKN